MIITRAFVRDVVTTGLAVTLVIFSMFFVIRGVNFLHDAARGVIPVSAVLSLVSLAMVSYLDIIMPLMFYIALILVVNRWHSERQLTVLAGCGVSLLQFIRPILWLNLIVVGLVAFFSLYLAPLSAAKGRQLEEAYRQSSEVNGVIIGRFVPLKKSNTTYFVEDFDRETGFYRNVFVNQGSFEREGVVVAKSAYRTKDENTNDQFLVLQQGSRYEGKPGLPEYRVIDYEQYAIRIEPPQSRKLNIPVKAQPTLSLLNRDAPQYFGELTWRIAKIFIFPVLSIFAIAIPYIGHRDGKAHGGVLALLVCLTYNNFLGYSITLVKNGSFGGSSMPVWLVHLGFALLACYFLYRRHFNLPLAPLIEKLSIYRRKAVPTG